jgi:hypothetical protein
MALKDRIKAQAGQLADKAHESAAQAQAKFGAMQAKRGADALLHDLGAAYYAEQRQGGTHDGVEKALAALDAHAEAHGPIDVSTSGSQEASS